MNIPLILITNDDGYAAAGIQALARTVAHLGEVYVVAPDGPRSGAAASITCTAPVSYKQLTSQPDYPANIHLYACSGTPVDCVKLAWDNILPRRPDLILSGINHGDNASISVHYSGTMGAVFEGCMKGIPSIGFSLYLQRGQRYEDYPVCDAALAAISKLCKQIIENGLPQDVCLNVNFPVANSFRGFQLCRQARGRWTAEWASATNPHGLHSYWLTGQFQDLEPDATDTDFSALRAGYTSIVPITIDMTAHGCFDDLRLIIDQ